MTQLKPDIADIPSRGAWQIDQAAICQGIAAETLARMDGHDLHASGVWNKVLTLAAEQPIVSSVSSAVLAEIIRASERLGAVAETLVVIGTGGASLGAQALCAFAGNRPPRVMFLENCDAYSVETMFARTDPARTAWVIISKSGETVETLAASLALAAHYQALGASLAERVLVITSPGPRPLRTLADHHRWATLDHPPQLGGRFSVFSSVGLVPAHFAGLDPAALIDAARAAWNEGLNSRDPLLYEAARWFATSLGEHPLHVVMGYSDRLRPYTQWYKQLWAESLGKQGRGPTPITAVGAIDQHSQLQLYLDGARDKLFTLILPEGADAEVQLGVVDIPAIAYLSHHTMQDIMHASAAGTVATMKAKGLPLRVLKGKLCAKSLCQLMARTMIETLLVAAMLEVDPYSQPAVEEGKQRARRSLGLQS